MVAVSFSVSLLSLLSVISLFWGQEAETYELDVAAIYFHSPTTTTPLIWRQADLVVGAAAPIVLVFVVVLVCLSRPLARRHLLARSPTRGVWLASLQAACNSSPMAAACVAPSQPQRVAERSVGRTAQSRSQSQLRPASLASR